MTSLLLVAVGCLTLGVLLGRWSVWRDPRVVGALAFAADPYVRHALLLMDLVRVSPTVIFWAVGPTDEVLVSAGGRLSSVVTDDTPEHLQQGARDGYLQSPGNLRDWGKDEARDAAIARARFGRVTVWESVGPSGLPWLSLAALGEQGVVSVWSVCLAEVRRRMEARIHDENARAALERLEAYARLREVPDAS